MEISTITTFVIGLIVGAAAVAAILPSVNRRTRARHQLDLRRLESELGDLRRELADDREVNRRLRRELVVNTPENLVATRQERDSAIDELDQLRNELENATLELANRDRSLREARLAIHDIRVELERDRFAGEVSAARSAAEAVAADADRQLAADGDGELTIDATLVLDESPFSEPTNS